MDNFEMRSAYASNQFGKNDDSWKDILETATYPDKNRHIESWVEQQTSNRLYLLRKKWNKQSRPRPTKSGRAERGEGG